MGFISIAEVMRWQDTIHGGEGAGLCDIWPQLPYVLYTATHAGNITPEIEMIIAGIDGFQIHDEQDRRG